MSTTTTIIEYSVSVDITKINGAAPTANMNITGANLTIEGTAQATKLITTIGLDEDGLPSEQTTSQDVTSQLSVGVKFGSSATLNAATTTNGWKNWKVIKPVPAGNANADGNLLITAVAQISNEVGNDAVTVNVDSQPPSLIINKPGSDETFVLNGANLSVPLQVMATDDRQVTEVKWSLDNTAYNNAIALSQQGQGSAQVPVTTPGEHTIHVRAKDSFGKTTERSVTIDVAQPLTPVDPENITGLVSYLAELLAFAAKRVKISPTSTGSAEAALPAALDVATIFGQRFDELVQLPNRAAALQSVNQSRIGVDTLRRYLLNRVPQWQDFPEELAAAEAGYRLQAYDALLRALGTSYKELRTAAVGDADTRATLADRLGIGVESLSVLMLDRNNLTELQLEQVFGLADTHAMRDPFMATAAPPTLLEKRRIYLRAAWLAQDETTQHPVFGMTLPVIDPDLVQASDLGTESVRQLWTARQNQITQILASLRGQMPRPGDNVLQAFSSILDTALGQGTAVALLGLFSAHKNGQDVEPGSHRLFLDLPAFLYLMNFHSMVERQIAPLADEWEQLFSIIVQIIKLRDLYSTWRAEEVAKAIPLGPDDFKLAAVTAATPNLTLWRATRSVRQAWLTRLAARIEQSTSLVENLKAAVEIAEAETLPLLREVWIGLIEESKTTSQPDDTVDLLTAELFIDFRSGGNQKTTRVEQAIETLQGILFALRMGRLALKPVIGPNPAANWRLDTTATYKEAEFDQEWQWMGSYAAWRTAMNVFLFPENFLRPTMRPLPPAQTPTTPPMPAPQTKAFNTLAASLREKLRLTRKLARQEASDYLTALKIEVSQAQQLLGSFNLVEPVSMAEVEALVSKINAIFTSVFGATAPQKFHDVPAWVQEAFYFVPLLLAEHLERSGEFLAALDWYKAVYAHMRPASPKVYKGLTLDAGGENNFAPTTGWLLEDFNPHKIALTRVNVYTRFTIMALVKCLLAFADDQFAKETVETLPQARSLYLTVLELLNLPEMKVTSQLAGKQLENVLLNSLRNHAKNNLLKLRNDLNIAGLARPRRAENTNKAVTRRPTPYRYQVLIERAKQLASTAGQIEANFLSALEKRDAEQYALLQAQQDIELADAQVQLQELRVTEAEDGIDLAALQRDRAQLQAEHFQGLLEQGLLPEEQAMIRSLRTANIMAGISGALAVAGMVGAGIAATVATGGAAAPAFLAAAAGLAGSSTAAQIAGAAGLLGGITGTVGGAASGRASLQSTLASFERRREDWELQFGLAQQDILMGNQQILLAQDHFQITQQELEIAGIQAEHAMETLTFLANKFTNAELFDWMSRVLERIYAYFLQQTAAVARLAEAQLAFERQEALPSFIRADYWQAPDESVLSNGSAGVDRRGLTGSSRLLQDITELDQYAFTTDRRRLQLTKTFSLAALAPAEFQRFRETGVMLFATLMDYFDREFPGHYLRLIKRVRTTVIALTPPTHGIRATLSNLGVSRVVIDDNGFRPLAINHGPQSVALSTPLNATGVFELDPQSDMLLPFESIGVDTSWEFRMPKAANPFDFRAVADVLITLDFTALDSPVYQKQVIDVLPQAISAEQPYSIRNQFADQWYDLHNPDLTASPMTIRIEIQREDLPPNLSDFRLRHLLVYFARVEGETFEVAVEGLNFTPMGAATAVKAGAAQSQGGIISTRRGNAGAWLAQLPAGRTPFGTWELKLQDSPLLREKFSSEQIEDVLFVFTYDAQMAAWPS